MRDLTIRSGILPCFLKLGYKKRKKMERYLICAVEFYNVPEIVFRVVKKQPHLVV